ncbi:hypothetical protein [Streptococcus lutetiensis]|uniref:hypothetical protein n=1 Tax=Streptococcus lutetiensis TaxID=150055 RepID=UPI0005C6AC4B|nr:hypothetical protein [Streptococcus lutetiensis]
MKEERVKAEIMCPFCGMYMVLKIKKHRKSVSCPGCRERLYLKKTNDKGFYFRASEAYGMRKITREFEEMFEEKKSD